MSDYVDVRELINGFERHRCPECGTKGWFKHLERDRWPKDQWNCQRCGSYLQDTLEYPCPKCRIRMKQDGGAFECRNVDCPHDRTPIDTKKLIDQMTDEYSPGGYAHGRFEDCPVCGETSILNGPDGERQCDECGLFYAGRFMDTWYCYAIWKRNPELIRVTESV